MTDRKIALKITTETPKAELVGQLASELDRLAKEGGKAGPQFKKLAAEIRAMEAPAAKADGTFAKLRGSMSGLGGAVSSLGAGLGKLAGFLGIGGAGIAGGLVAVATSAATAADEMGKLSQRTGISTESLSRLAYAASLSDATTADLEMGFKTLSERMQDAAEGGTESSAMFKALGISVKDADGSLRGVDVVFSDLAEQFKTMPDGAEKTALAVDLFSRSGLALIPTLNNGREGLKQLADESDRFGKTISAEAAAKAAQFNDDLVRLQTAMRGVSQEIGMAVVPALDLLAQAFLESYKEQGKLVDGGGLETWATRGAKAVGFMVDALDGAARMVEIVGVGIGAYAAMAVEVAKGNVKEAKAIYEALGDDVAAILAQPQFSARIDRQLDAAPERERQAAAAREESEAKQQVDRLKALEANLASERVRLAKLAAGEIVETNKTIEQADSERTKAQIKNAETLRDALLKAWEAARQGAQKAGDDAAALLQKAADAQSSRSKQAQDRRDKSLTPDEAEAKNTSRASELTDAASTQATFAQNAAIDGRAKEAQAYAQKALDLSKEAAEYAGKVQDDGTAARMLEQIGATEKAAIEAQAKIKQQEQAEFEQTADAQLAKIREIEAELQKIKQVKIDADTAEAQATITALQAQINEIKDKTVTVTVVQKGTVPDGATVTTADIPARAYGGPLPGIAKGIRSDNQLYMGTPGEWVVDIPTVQHYGADFMRDLLQRRVPRYAYGGEIGGASSALAGVSMPSVAASPAASQRPLVGSTLVIPGVGKYPIQTSQEVHDDLQQQLQLAALQVGRR